MVVGRQSLSCLLHIALDAWKHNFGELEIHILSFSLAYIFISIRLISDGLFLIASFPLNFANTNYKYMIPTDIWIVFKVPLFILFLAATILL